MICSACGADNEAGRKFCKECGTALVVICGFCSSPNAPESKFCGECGRPLTAAGPGAIARELAPPSATPAPADDRRVVHILFSDRVGSTTMDRRHDAVERREH